MSSPGRLTLLARTGRLEELLEHLVRWNLHPERIITHRYPLEQAGEAYRVADRGAAGKVCIVFE